MSFIKTQYIIDYKLYECQYQLIIWSVNYLVLAEYGDIWTVQ